MIILSPRRMMGYLLVALIAAPMLAYAQSEPSVGDIQIFKNPRESVAVFPRVAPVDKSGALVAPGDAAAQLKQALENLRRLAGRVGISPAHFVTLTIYVKEKSGGDQLHTIAQDSFADWNPATTLVETNELRVAGALIEVEGVALVRTPRPGR
jgi:enamine deaminase RidA (YjgF/YER057c/UK114 family)